MNKIKFKDILKNNPNIFIIVTVCVVIIIITIFASYKSTKKDVEENSNVDLKSYTINKQWDIDSWIIEPKSFTFYFKNSLVDYSNYYKEIGDFLVISFYGEDNSQFAFQLYSSPDSNIKLGSEIALQFVPDEYIPQIETWRKSQTPIAVENINNFEYDFNYYILNSSNFNFTNNEIIGTTYKFNISNCRYSSEAVETNYRFLTKKNYGYEFVSAYGMPIEMIEATLSKGYNDKITEDMINKFNLKEFNYNQEYYVIPVDKYNEFASLSDRNAKIDFVNEYVLDKDNKDIHIVKLTSAGFCFKNSYWYYNIENEKTIEELGTEFMPSAGSSGSSLKPEGNPVSLNSYLAYCNMCSIEQAKTLTIFIEENINKIPNLYN